MQGDGNVLVNQQPFVFIGYNQIGIWCRVAICTGSIPVVLVLLYFIICYKLWFLWHIVTGYSVNGSMRVLGTCSVGSSPAILMSGV